MKPTNLFALLLILTTALLPVSCGRAPEKPTRFWDTGNATVDSLLTLADYYELMSACGEKREAFDSTLMAVAAMKEASPSAALLAGIWRNVNNGNISYTDIQQLDSIASDSTNITKSPYLAARAKMEMAPYLDLEKRNQIYFDLAAYFTNVSDSLCVVYTLMRIVNAYAEIDDTATRLEFLQETMHFIPDSLPKLRSIMAFNHLFSLRIHPEDRETYKRLLDSVRYTSIMDAPEFATLIYCDLYRYKGNPAHMDTAATYYARIPNKSDHTAQLYRIYQLQLFDERGLVDSAKTRCAELEAMVMDGNIYNLEIIPTLIWHYKYTGNEAAIPPLRQQHSKDSLSLVAMHKANKMSHIKASQKMTRLKQILHPPKKNHDSHGWLPPLAIAAAVIAGVSLFLYRHRRKSSLQQPQPEELPADNADREMVAAHLVSATNDTEEKSTALGGFDIAFSRVRPGFTDELLALHPKLTAYELRLCSLLSIGLDTKEIARILSINPDSVKKSRQRLRAKLGIPSDMTFIEYFCNLPQ